MDGFLSGCGLMQCSVRCLRECGARGVRRMMDLSIGSVRSVWQRYSQRRYRHMKQLSLIWCAVIIAGLVAASISFAATATWTESADADGYRLYRAAGTCTTPGSFSIIETYGVVNTGVVQNPATNGTYCYKITAYNFAGESPFSNTVQLRSVTNPPLAPQNFSVKP